MPIKNFILKRIEANIYYLLDVPIEHICYAVLLNISCEMKSIIKCISQKVFYKMSSKSVLQNVFHSISTCFELERNNVFLIVCNKARNNFCTVKPNAGNRILIHFHYISDNNLIHSYNKFAILYLIYNHLSRVRTFRCELLDWFLIHFVVNFLLNSILF